jgi:hypothetical protein
VVKGVVESLKVSSSHWGFRAVTLASRVRACCSVRWETHYRLLEGGRLLLGPGPRH